MYNGYNSLFPYCYTYGCTCAADACELRFEQPSTLSVLESELRVEELFKARCQHVEVCHDAQFGLSTENIGEMIPMALAAKPFSMVTY